MKTRIILWISLWLFSSRAYAIFFYENKGQWPSWVRYRGELPSGFVFLGSGAVQFSFYDSRNPHFFHPYRPTQHTHLATGRGDKIRCSAYRMEFLGANAAHGITPGSTHSPDYRNYLLGNDPNRHAFGVLGYDTVWYQEVYRGVDFRMFWHQYDLKYEFVVWPGADVSQVQVRYTHAREVFLRYGNLHIVHDLDTVIEIRPHCYQFVGGRKVEVPSRFVLDDDVVSYEFPTGYDTSQPLIIDPKLVFSSYSGSISDNWGNTAAHDSLGNMYSAGTSFGNNFPTTVGSFDVSFNGEVDVAIIKYASDGSKRLFSTFYGGEEADIPVSIICNSFQDLVILGITSSEKLPVSRDSFKNKHSGGNFVSPISGYNLFNGGDLFLARIRFDGKALVAATYVGGNGSDGINLNIAMNKNYGDAIRNEVILDSADNPCIVYYSNSTNLVVGRRYGSTLQGSVYIQKFNPTLSKQYWLTAIGGSGLETGCSIRFKNGKVLIGGATTSSDFPTTAGCAFSRYIGGLSDGFLALLDAASGELLACTLIGTPSYDKVFYVDFDPNSSDVYCFGQTSGRFAVSSGLYSNPRSGQFIARMNYNLSAMLASTVVGSGDGTPDIVPTGFQVTRCNNINLTGWAGMINQPDLENNTTEDDGFVGGSTRNLPVTQDAFIKTVAADSSDFYFMVLSLDMKKLVYATFFGGTRGNGEHVDGGTSRFSEDGTVYQAVCACRARDQSATAPNIPTTDGSAIGSNNCNNLAFKFDLGTLNPKFTATQKSGCAPLTVTFSSPEASGEKFIWEIVGILRQESTQNKSLRYTFTTPGTYLVRYTIINQDFCVKEAQFVDTVKVFRPDYEISADTLICQGESARLVVSGGVSYQWLPPLNSTSPSVVVQPKQTTFYRVRIIKSEDCQVVDTIKVTVVPPITPQVRVIGSGPCASQPIITAQNATLIADEFLWVVAGTDTIREAEFRKTMRDTGCYTVYFRAAKGRCKADTSFSFCLDKIMPPNVITPNSDQANDRFIIGTKYNPHRLVIVNRWGEIVYQSEDYKGEWDAALLPEGVYYYLLTDTDGQTCKGWIMVDRGEK